MLRAWHPTITRGPRLAERLRFDARTLLARRTATPQPRVSGLRAGRAFFRASTAAAMLVAVILGAGPMGYSDSLIEALQIDRWWRDDNP